MTDSLVSDPFVSVVIPVFDEQEVLPLLLGRLWSTMDGLSGDWEIWVVNDGSRDRSLEILEAEAARQPRLKILDLSRNFGHPAAISAGLDHAEGDVVVVMDADLQDPPEIIPEMLSLFQRGFDVVHARRSARLGESAFKKLSARVFHGLMRLAAAGTLVADVGEFRLMSRPVVRALRRFGERRRLVRGLVSWLGFRQTTLDFERPGRAAGVSKFPLRRMLRLGWDGMTGFSKAPLRLAALMGLILLAAGLAGALYVGYLGLWLGTWPPGWISLAVLQLLVSAIVLLCLGMVGEYVGRIFEEVKGRPLYVVRRTVNQAPPPADGS